MSEDELKALRTEIEALKAENIRLWGEIRYLYQLVEEVRG